MCQLELDDYAEVWEETEVKRARKQHRCDMCLGWIAVGDPYVRHFSVSDGYPTSEKKCNPCKAICEAFQKHHHWMGTPSSMREFLTECIDQETISKRWSGKDHDEVSPTGQMWQSLLDEMRARRRAAEAS